MDCYHVNTQPLPWRQASAECDHVGAKIVTINNVYDQAFLDTILATDITAWIGLSAVNVSG